MFDAWAGSLAAAVRRAADPPRPVLVDLTRMIPAPDDAFRLDAVPMWTKLDGLDVSCEVTGLVHGWVKSARGSWLALVSVDIPTGNRQRQVTVHHLCAARALTPLLPTSPHVPNQP
ncbi:hypothetical protein [Mycobacteroides abscessus]|uniref:hypothetical protein n=1 Tax=Mycobacteroides abscessus TaxID=36809 RepID=UPI0009A67C3D|nr:hypothetical protein [Mycobacteroides abscessus]SLJ76132.1 Uncharacterised protein [Mycobacteroides abscessus subsp. abscessus]SLJ80555.1 Uncharacterised protein [Mycobacteroides abscessus subsp. abscessus]